MKKIILSLALLIGGVSVSYGEIPAGEKNKVLAYCAKLKGQCGEYNAKNPHFDEKSPVSQCVKYLDTHWDAFKDIKFDMDLKKDCSSWNIAHIKTAISKGCGTLGAVKKAACEKEAHLAS